VRTKKGPVVDSSRVAIKLAHTLFMMAMWWVAMARATQISPSVRSCTFFAWQKPTSGDQIAPTTKFMTGHSW
jgi:hypothetical protein